MPQWSLFELFCIGHEAQEGRIFHIRSHVVSKLLHCQILQVVAAGDKTEISRHYKSIPILALVDFNTA